MIGFDNKCYQVGDTVELSSDVNQPTFNEDGTRIDSNRGVVRRDGAGWSNDEVHVEFDNQRGRLFSGSPRMFRGIEPPAEWHLVERLTWTPDHDQK